MITEVSVGIEVVDVFPGTVCTHTPSHEVVEGVRHDQVVVLVRTLPLPPHNHHTPPIYSLSLAYTLAYTFPSPADILASSPSYYH